MRFRRARIPHRSWLVTNCQPVTVTNNSIGEIVKLALFTLFS